MYGRPQLHGCQMAWRHSSAVADWSELNQMLQLHLELQQHIVMGAGGCSGHLSNSNRSPRKLLTCIISSSSAAVLVQCNTHTSAHRERHLTRCVPCRERGRERVRSWVGL